MTAMERSMYVSKYLNGGLYTDEAAAREHLDIQRTNAAIAYEKCKEAFCG